MEELERWVELAQQGDQDAFGRVVTSLQPRLFPVLFRMVRDEDVAAELCQRTWIKVWRKLDQFSGRSAFFTWVYRVGTTTALDWMRRRKREGRVQYLDEVDLTGETEPHRDPLSSQELGPDAALQRKEVFERFEAALEQLSDLHRTTLVLREVEGHSYAEIADIMSCKVGTVMSRIHHARKQIQENLGEMTP